MKIIYIKNITHLALISISIYVAYFFHGGTNFSMVPIHHDDYTNLSSYLSDMFLSGKYDRPISTIIIALMSKFGEIGYLIFQLIFLSTYLYLVIYFLSDLLKVKITWFSVVIASVFISTLPNLVEYHFYTGLMTNLSSALFGMMALVIFHRFNGRRYFGWVTFFLFLSAFSKEDYILPFIVYTSLSYFYLKFIKNTNDSLRPYLNGTIVALFILVSSLVYNRIAGSAFVSSNTNYYAISINILDILSVYEFYFLRSLHLKLLVGLPIILSFLYVLFSRDKSRACFNLLAVIVMSLSLAAPYSLLKNHLAPYYSFMWFVWISLFSLIIIQDLTSRMKIFNNYAYIIISSMIVVFFSLQFESERGNIIRWYENQHEITSNILKNIRKLTSEHKGVDKVLVINPPGLSPWSHSSGQYLERRMNTSNQWIVLVNESDGFYQIGEENKNIVIMRNTTENMGCEKYPYMEFRSEQIIIGG